jgi:predicted PurR-regulated permease PerM
VCSPGTMKSDATEAKVWTTNRVVLATLFVVCVLLFLWLLYRFRFVVFLVFIAIVIGTTIRPAVEWLYRRGISRAAGIILIYLLMAGLIAGFLALFVPLIVDQATLFSQHLPEYQADFRNALIGSNNLILRNIGLRIPTRFDFFGTSTPTTEEVFDQVTQTFRYADLLIKAILSILAVFLLAYHWTQESNFMIRNLLQLIPRSRRQGVREFLQMTEARIAGYVRGQALLSLVVGFASFLAYTLIGLPYAVFLAIVAGFMELVPILGPALGAIPAFLVALSVEPGAAIWVVVSTMVIQAMENAWLVPRIMNHAMGVNPIIVILSIIAFSSLYGLAGAVFALPVAAILQLIFERIVSSARESGGVMHQIGEPTIETLLKKSGSAVEALRGHGDLEDRALRILPDDVRQELHSIALGLHGLLERIEKEEGE